MVRIALLLLVVFSAFPTSAQTEEPPLIFVDGRVIPNPAYGRGWRGVTRSSAFPIAPPGEKYFQIGRGIQRLGPEIRKPIVYLWESSNLSAANEKARERIAEGLKEHEVVAVVVTADKPLDLSLTPDDPNFVNEYFVSPAAIGESTNDVYSKILGRGVPELKAPDKDGLGRASYPRYILIGVRGANGDPDIRYLSSQEQQAYLDNQRQLYYQELNRRATLARHEKEEAKKRADEEQSRLAKEEAQRKAEEEKRVNEQKKRAEDERKSLAENKAERDRLCAGGRSAECLLADDRLTNQYEKYAARVSTAMCGVPSYEDSSGSLIGGLCSPDAPPCIECSMFETQNDFIRYETRLNSKVGVNGFSEFRTILSEIGRD